MHTYLTIFRRALAGFGKDQCTSFAAAIAYYALFSLFPLVVFALSFLGFLIHSAAQRENVVNAIFLLLGQGVDKNALYAQVNAFAGGRGGLGIVGLLAAIWSASAVFGAIRTGLNAAWNVTKSRPFAATKLLDLTMVLGVGLLILLSMVSTGVLTAIEGFSSQLFENQIGLVAHLLVALLLLGVPPAISFVAFAFTYYVVPHAEVRLRDVWLGALLAAVLFQIAQLGFGVYAANFAHYDRVYGSLGAVIAFLFFVYVSAAILLFGGEVTRECVDVRAAVKPVADRSEAAPARSLRDRAAAFIKGLFIDRSPQN